ncbi:hypothetical protein [Streptomyces sp. NPDC088350]|uniref:hypothetical protein n=1 Tax=Streptomyces sp. NPDC088350 TaxID=3365854 RepID=UPI00381F611D
MKEVGNDPKSAPDVMEYGSTGTAGYVHDGGPQGPLCRARLLWPRQGEQIFIFIEFI